VEAELARGALPPGRLADRLIARVQPVVEAIAAQPEARADGGATARSVDVAVPLGGGRSLGGTVAGVRGDVLLAVTYARVGPRPRLAAWVRLLALTAADPERPWSAAVVGRVRRGGPALAEVTVVRLSPLDDAPALRAERALAHLAVLLDLYDRGMREPLPLAAKASAAYAEAAHAGGDALAAGCAEWESGFRRPREDVEPEHRLALGGVLPFTELLALPPRPDEAGPGWAAGEASRFGRLALRLWDGPLACEQREDR
jgi:exodeoxyribonuclease V gamma subunit